MALGVLGVEGRVEGEARAGGEGTIHIILVNANNVEDDNSV